MSISQNAPWHAIPSFALIAPYLERASEVIYGSLMPSDSAGEMAPLLDHFRAHSGKMIRPGLVLLGGACLGSVTDEHVRVAAMVEMIHDATLLHDDVMDEGRTRRGVPTVNHLWGNESAVLLGDFVLSRVFQMTAELDPPIAKAIADTAVRVCLGELRQASQRWNWQLTEQEYISIISDKSASFFSGCCRMGGLLAEAATAQIDALDRFGLCTGIAFQIVDDLLDISGDEAQTGKTPQCDLYKSKLTLAVIHLLASVDTAEREDVYALLHDPAGSKGRLDEMLARYGSMEYAQKRARDYVRQAIGALADLPEGEARDALVDTAHFMVERAA